LRLNALDATAAGPGSRYKRLLSASPAAAADVAEGAEAVLGPLWRGLLDAAVVDGGALRSASPGQVDVELSYVRAVGVHV
jgi:hypothetical protein